MKFGIARRWFGFCAAALVPLAVVASPLHAADEEKPKVTLKVGDPAPKLAFSKWLKGEPVKELEKGKIYIMEFWATWCGPCVAAMPHVSKLQQQFADKGVVVIGVNVWEQDPSKVEPFVSSAGDRMAYRVAVDTPIEGTEYGRMHTDWLLATGQQGIPFTVLVDREGKVAWSGHPMQLDRPLTALVAGKYDAKEQADFEAKMEKLDEQVADAVKAKEFDKATALVDQIAALDPPHANEAKVAKMSILMDKGDWETVTKLATELIDVAAKEKDSALAGRLGSTLVLAPAGAPLKPELQLKAAELAYQLNESQISNVRMLAMAYAKNGKFDKAVEMQEKVVTSLQGFLREREKKVLDEYKSKIK